MRIGIDIDGVLTDIESYQIEVGGKFFQRYGKSVVNRNGYELYEIFDVSEDLDEQFWVNYLIDYVTNEPARKFSGEVIQKLKNEGNEIYIVTARYLTTSDTKEGSKMRELVKKWLKKQNIYYDKIIFSDEDKKENCKAHAIDIMIEDKKENIEEISKMIPVICFDAGYNRDCAGDNIYRVYNWYDIYNLISGGKLCNRK